MFFRSCFLCSTIVVNFIVLQLCRCGRERKRSLFNINSHLIQASPYQPSQSDLISPSEKDKVLMTLLKVSIGCYGITVISIEEVKGLMNSMPIG